MPYSNVPEEKEEEALPQEEPMEEKETEANIPFLPSEDEEPVGLAAELGAEEAPVVEQEAMAEDIEGEGEPEQEIEEGVEGPPAGDVSGIVKVEFIDDGDDFEMDAFIRGSKGSSPYPDMRGQEPPPYTPPDKKGPSPSVEETPLSETAGEGGQVQSTQWTPPDISIQQLMDMEPAAMFYNGSVKDVVQSERELRAFRRKVNRMQEIADLRPQEWKKETVVERVVGVFRRIFRHYGPGPHPGTGTEQTIHAGGRGAGADVGVAERPKHVGASIKLQQMASPRTTSHVNDADYSSWKQISDDSSGWGTDKETGEIMESGAWSIASNVLDNVQSDLGGEPRTEYGETTEPDEYIVQQAVDEMIAGDVENDHYEIERQLKNLADNIRGEILGSNPTWADISEMIGKSEDEMMSMSEADIDEAIEKHVSLGVIDVLEQAERGEDVSGLEGWMTSHILASDSTSELRENLEDYSYDVVDYLQAGAYDALSDYHEQNPTGYDYDYFIDELGLEPETFGVGREEESEYYEGEGEFTNHERTYFYSTDNETGEIVAVMQTTRAYENIADRRIREAAERFGFDPDDVSGEMLSIDLLASKYPRQGYGTEMILNALEQAHEEDRGLMGSAVMAASMFYDKLGAQYLSEMGQTEGGSAFWTNVQVHAAYEWLQGQMEGIESGEITEAEIEEEQAGAEAREDYTPPPPVRGESTGLPYGQMEGRRLPNTLGEIAGTIWIDQGAGTENELRTVFDSQRGEWSLVDAENPNAVLYTYDAEDAEHFFNRLANEAIVPELATTLSPQHIASAIRDGALSIDVDRPRQETEIVAPESLRAMAGTTWSQPQGGGDITIDHDPVQHAWFATDAAGNEMFTNDEEDVSTFFSRLNRDLFRPTNPYVANAEMVGEAIIAGRLSTDIDETIPTATEQIFGRRDVSAATLLGAPQATDLSLNNPVAANSTFISFVTPGEDRPVVAMEVDRARDGNRWWEIIGTGQIFDTRDRLLTELQNDNWTSGDYGVVGSDTFGNIMEEINNDEERAQNFTYNMLMESRERINTEQNLQSIADERALREAELAEASLRHDSLRRVDRHYGPGPHPGTGTPQSVHGKGGGGKTRVGITSARPGKPSGQVFEEMGVFSGELNKIPTIKNVSVTPGVGGWEGERESAWIVSYEGNGNAMRLIARTAKEKEQEAVIFAREGGEEPISTFAFSDRVTPDERDKVEGLLVEAGVGWSWLRLPGGQPTLMIMNVPQYGGEAETHRQSMKKLTQMFDAIEMPHEFKEEVRKVDILEKEGPYGYDTILEAGN